MRDAWTRGGILLACGVWLTWMGARYTDVVTSRTGWIEACTADKASCDGRRVFLALSEVVAIDGDGFVIRKVTNEHRVTGDPAGLELGETVSVIARFDASDDSLTQTWRESHPWREEKVVLGLVGLAMALGFAVYGVRWRDGFLVSRG